MLIIGAFLNETTGHAICYFDIYDPQFPSYKQRISYEFVISKSTTGLNELTSDSWISQKNGKLVTQTNQLVNFSMYGASGKLLLEVKNVSEFDLRQISPNQLVFLQISEPKSGNI